MPGIYLNDGGQTSSALGSILGGIAAGVGPKAQAEAQLLKLQSEEADRQNALLSNVQQGANAMPQYLNAPGVNADPTASAGGGTVAGTLASAAQPPAWTPFTRDQTAGFSPFSRIMAGSYSKDPSMANVATGVNLGQSGTVGPTKTYSALAAAGAPVSVSPGVIHFTNPTDPNAPTVTGGSAYTGTAETAAATADQAEARNDSSIGLASQTNLANLQQLDQLYDAVVAPGADVPGLAQELAVRKLAEATGIDLTRFSTVEGAKEEIRRRLGGMLESARQSQGNPALRGGFEAIQSTLPSADMSPERYHSMSNAFATSLQRQIADGTAADAFLKTPSPDTANARRNAIGANRAAEAAALAKAGFGPEPAAAALRPADPTTVQRLKVKWQQAGGTPKARAAIIAAAKENGVDAEAGGF